MRIASAPATWKHAAIFGLAVSLLLPCPSANGRPDDKNTGSEKTAAPTDTKLYAQIVLLLSAGRQAEAEELIAIELARYPEAVQVAKLIARRQFDAAQHYKEQHAAAVRPAKTALFLFACCQRSRFAILTALPFWNVVWMLDHTSPEAKCAYYMMAMDSKQLHDEPEATVDRVFGDLRKLCDENPDHVMVRWMLAVQCRNWNRNQEGADAYEVLLERWHPGPALVHQTYANLLDELKRYNDALAERYLVVAMEPAPWSYDGLGNTLQHLNRFDESCAAHEIAVRLDPTSSLYFSNWAIALNGKGDFDGAIEKCKRALQLQPTSARAYWMWGKALDGQGKPNEALAKCLTARALFNRPGPLDEYIADLRQRQK